MPDAHRSRIVTGGGISLDEALEATRTGDLWLFRGHSGPDRAIQSLTNAPVNHVAMAVCLDDLPPLMWHAELGERLTDVWTGDKHRGVQLHDAHEAAVQWMDRYGQDCWLRQLSPVVGREHENALLTTIARLDGTPFPATVRLAGRWFRGRIPTSVDWVRGVPWLEGMARRRRAAKRQQALDSPVGASVAAAYCAEVVAITYADMGLLDASKDSNWFDPGRFWSGDHLPLEAGFQLGDEIRVWR